jgi:hypothetical protein
VSSWDLLPMIREVYSRQPETRHLLAWELRIILWCLGYTDELESEAEIASSRTAADFLRLPRSSSRFLAGGRG